MIRFKKWKKQVTEADEVDMIYMVQLWNYKPWEDDIGGVGVCLYKKEWHVAYFQSAYDLLLYP